MQRFPEMGSKRQISNGGGNQVRWRRDGLELYFIAPDGGLMAVDVRDPVGLELGPPTPLFSSRVVFLTAAGAGVGPLYDVTGDGRRFLMVETPTDLGPPITIVTSWRALLE